MRKRIGIVMVVFLVLSTLVAGCAGTYGGGTARTPEERAAMEKDKKDMQKERERENKETVRDILDSGFD